MAMLAEPRRKQKWSVDPRNSTWSKDESKFGQKMLEKMGWSKGKGLGAQEQGSTEHIKVQVKNNTLGLGANIKHEDNWIAHQDDFNQILAELNNCHGTAESESPASEDKKSFSLEEKSKSSKKRVHYMKFAKGKDLSSRSETDLACIFGKREKSKKTKAQEESVEDSEENEIIEHVSPPNDSEPRNTVTSTLSVSEYFAQRMAQLKKSQAKRAEKEPERTEPAERPSEETKKSKKKKRNKSNKTLDGPGEPETVDHPEEEDCLDTTECPEPKKKSKKKRKNKDMGAEKHGSIVEEEDPSRVSDCEAEDEKPKKQKKKNKRRKEEAPEQSDEVEVVCPSNTEEPMKKKKKKKQLG
ncbi:PIN2/TERF1-interacting telomerase inhibitor 1 [Discoglossus pictus]